MLALPCRVRKEIRIGPAGLKPTGARNRIEHPLKSLSIIVDPAFNQEVAPDPIFLIASF